jgi:hypothetical protein
MFENKLFGYTFFVHNLGDFDGLYLIDSIVNDGLTYAVKGKYKSDENKLIGLTIINKKTNKRIFFKDSLNFFNASLA